MFLAVDVGNSQTTIGFLGDDGSVLGSRRITTEQSDTSDELEIKLRALLAINHADWHGAGGTDRPEDTVEVAALASVVPILTRAWKVCLTRMGFDPFVVSATGQSLVPIALPDPTAVGADRVANAAAALETYGAPSVVVDFGTATNIDVVNAEGEFVGGVIAPGLMISAQALFARAAKLANVSIKMPPDVIGDSSEHALQSGLVIGTAAMAEGLARRIREELAEAAGCDLDPASIPVIATGGLARTVSQATDAFTAIDPSLTLRGIHRLWQASRE